MVFLKRGANLVTSLVIRKGETSIMNQSGLRSNSQQQSNDRFASTWISVRCCHRRWWINRPALCKPTSGQFLVMSRPRQAFSSQSEAPSECFCGHLHRSPRDMILHPDLAWMPLKRKPAARGTRAPRLPSIVGWLCRLPSPASVVGTVAPDGYPLVLVAA
jgi:hypothetical protein